MGGVDDVVVGSCGALLNGVRLSLAVARPLRTNDACTYMQEGLATPLKCDRNVGRDATGGGGNQTVFLVANADASCESPAACPAHPLSTRANFDWSKHYVRSNSSSSSSVAQPMMPLRQPRGAPKYEASVAVGGMKQVGRSFD